MGAKPMSPKTYTAGQPFIDLSAEEAEFLVLYGWRLIETRIKRKPPPPANLSDGIDDTEFDGADLDTIAAEFGTRPA